MPVIIVIKWMCFVPEIIWTGFGSFWAFKNSTNCAEYLVITVKVLVLCAWLLIFVILIGLLVVFDPSGSRSNNDHRSTSVSAAKKLWEMRYGFIRKIFSRFSGNFELDNK